MNGVSYQSEPFSGVIREALPLLRRHWQEVALYHDRIPLEPDFDYYYAMERMGRVALITARSHGTLVGYMMQVVGPGVHYLKTLWSNNVVLWVDPAFRGRIGLALLIKMEEHLRSRGVTLFEIESKIYKEDDVHLGRILDHRGFRRVAVVHHKVLTSDPEPVQTRPSE